MVLLSHFAYICISTFASHWHAKPPLFDIHGFAEQGDILIKFCVLIYFNIVQPPWFGKQWREFAKHHFGQSSYFIENAHKS